MNPALVAIPKELVKKGNLVLIPQKEYEQLLNENVKNFEEIKLTPFQKKRLNKARKNLKQGKTLTLYEFKRKLGFKN